MVNYRRSRTPGGSYFFTVNLLNRRASLLTDHVEYLRHAFRIVRQQHPFNITAIVVLPEHLHAIWELPPGDADYSRRWQVIKSRFTRSLIDSGETLKKNRKGEYALWQRRFWEHTIRDEIDLQRHIDYIHNNPVKHGWVDRVAEWPYSSFHRYVEKGFIPIDWGGESVEENNQTFGE